MGILTDAAAIFFGANLGSSVKRQLIKDKTLGIGIMLISLVSFLENIYYINGKNIDGENLLLVLFSFLVGSMIGEGLKLNEKLQKFGKTDNNTLNGFINSALFFGIGGLQISGPVELALKGSNHQLFIKSFIDIPFAITFGAAYGRVASLSFLPVAAMQGIIALIAFALSGAASEQLTAGICAMGYIILFFSGFNLVSDSKNKIDNVNMLPGIFVVIIFSLIKEFAGKIL